MLLGIHRCDLCHKTKPIALFNVFGFHDTYWCNSCANREFGKDYYISTTECISLWFRHVFRELMGMGD